MNHFICIFRYQSRVHNGIVWHRMGFLPSLAYNNNQLNKEGNAQYASINVQRIKSENVNECGLITAFKKL